MTLFTVSKVFIDPEVIGNKTTPLELKLLDEQEKTSKKPQQPKELKMEEILGEITERGTPSRPARTAVGVKRSL